MKKAFHWFSLVSLAFVLLSTVVRAEDSDYGTAGGVVLVPEGISASEVQRCIVEAAAGRGWEIRAKDDEKVVIFLQAHRWVSTLTLLYTPKQIQIFSKSTRGGKPKMPESWIENLRDDIGVKFRTLAATKK
ncbi:hypothetical protein DB347_03185 [Opitutaceae bacterium EW11]|nr:hypothetical protein DB347_03185 [Opitutaceae bacterium EW11]